MLEINITNILVTVIAVGLFSIPFFVHSMESKKSIKRMLLLLNESSAKHGISPSEHDIWRNQYVIALDHISSQVIFLDVDDSLKITITSLQAAASVDMEIKSRIVGKGQNATKIIETMHLVIHYWDNSTLPVRLEFYNEAKYPSPQNEYELINKWKNILSAYIEAEKMKRVPDVV